MERKRGTFESVLIKEGEKRGARQEKAVFRGGTRLDNQEKNGVQSGMTSRKRVNGDTIKLIKRQSSRSSNANPGKERHHH